MSEKQQGRATDRQLDEAHGFLVRCLITEIQEYRAGQVLDRHGRPQRCPTALYSELSKLLKVNAVDRPNREVDVQDTLLAELENEFGSFEVPIAPVLEESHEAPDDDVWCPECAQVLPREAFNKNSGRPNGLQSWCRECQKAR